MVVLNLVWFNWFGEILLVLLVNLPTSKQEISDDISRSAICAAGDLIVLWVNLPTIYHPPRAAMEPFHSLRTILPWRPEE